MRKPRGLVRIAVALAVLCAAAVTVVGQQQPDSQSQAPTFRGGVDAVQVDAFVTDASGRPVRGLTVDDFEVFRNDQAQPITTFATVDIPVTKSPAPAIADESDVAINTRPDGRIYMFMLSAMSPVFHAGCLLATTTPTPPPCMTSPSSTPFA